MATVQSFADIRALLATHKPMANMLKAPQAASFAAKQHRLNNKRSQPYLLNVSEAATLVLLVATLILTAHSAPLNSPSALATFGHLNSCKCNFVLKPRSRKHFISHLKEAHYGRKLFLDRFA